MKKLFIALITIPIASLVAIVATLVFYPGIIVNELTLSWSVDILDKAGIELKYKNLVVEVTSETIRKKQIYLSFDNLDLKIDNQLESHFSKAQFVFGLDLWGEPVLISQVGPIEIKSGFLRVIEPESPREEAESTANYLELIQHRTFKPITIKRLKLEMEDIDGRIKAAEFDVDSKVTSMGHLSISANLRGLSGFPIKKGNLNAVVKDVTSNRLPAGDIKASGQFTTGQSFDIDVSLDSRSQLIALANLKYQKMDVSLRSVGTLTSQKLDIGVNATAKNLTNGIRNLKFSQCLLSANSSKNYKSISASINSCEVSMRRGTLVVDEQLPLKLPKKFSANLTSDFKIVFDESTNIDSGSIKVDFEPIYNRLFRISGGMVMDISGVVGKSSSPKILVNVDTKIIMDRFENMVHDLERSQYAVPAPLNSLSGRLECHLKGKINYSKGIVNIPHKCSSNLKGKKQSLVFTESGKLNLKMLEEGLLPKLNADLYLKDINMYLPEMAISAPVPKLTSDPRFVRIDKKTQKSKPKKSKKSKKSSSFKYHVNVYTESKPVTIHAPSFNTAVPIHTKLTFSDHSPPHGDIDIAQFEIKLLNKKAYIKHIRLDLEESGVTKINAQAVVEKSDYDVIVDVLGTTNSPQLEITSDPPRPESELMSGLMYGGSYDQLGGSQKRSVGETQAALADGAISLVSMFYLAATPVESVGYNSHTKQFHAQVKLQKGTSLAVGSSTEGSSKVGLTKRLFGNWTFETFAVSEEEDEETRGVAMLRWTNRY